MATWPADDVVMYRARTFTGTVMTKFPPYVLYFQHDWHLNCWYLWSVFLCSSAIFNRTDLVNQSVSLSIYLSRVWPWIYVDKSKDGCPCLDWICLTLTHVLQDILAVLWFVSNYLKLIIRWWFCPVIAQKKNYVNLLASFSFITALSFPGLCQ